MVVSGAVFDTAENVAALSVCSSALLGRPFEVRVCGSTTAGTVGKESGENSLDQRAQGSQTSG